jgi:hypothetical protein
MIHETLYGIYGLPNGRGPKSQFISVIQRFLRDTFASN